MGVQHDGEVHRVLNGGHEVVCFLRRADTRHVLDADGGNTHLLQFLHHRDVLLQRVYRARGVGDRTGGDGTLCNSLLNGDFQIVHVVQRIKNADDVDAVANRGTDKAAHNVVTVVLVAKDVLAAQQHLQLGVGHLCPDLSQAFPGVLIQEAETDVKGCAAPTLHRIETSLVDRFKDPLELIIGHARCDQGLTGVTQHGFGKLYFLHPLSSCRYKVYWFTGSDSPDFNRNVTLLL